MTRRAVALAALAFVLAACESTETSPDAKTDIVVSVESVELPAELAADECYVGVPGVAILAQSPAAPAICHELRRRYLQRRAVVRWPHPLLRDPDGTTECFLERGGELVGVMRSTRDDALADAYQLADRICSDLRGDGWKAADRDVGG